MAWLREAPPEELLGKTLTTVVRGEDRLTLVVECRTRYVMTHRQDCCERVHLVDVCGELYDLIDEPLIQAEGVSLKGTDPETGDVFRATFYRFATRKGSVTLRWTGESNGYYSTEAPLYVLCDDDHPDALVSVDKDEERLW